MGEEQQPNETRSDWPGTELGPPEAPGFPFLEPVPLEPMPPNKPVVGSIDVTGGAEGSDVEDNGGEGDGGGEEGGD